MLPPDQQVTSQKLSERLRDLGVLQQSLFWWQVCADGTTELRYGKTTTNYGIPVQEHYAAFTGTELGELLPLGIQLQKGRKRITRDIYHTVRFSMFHQYNPVDADKKYLLRGSFHADTEAEARARCLIYLIENNLIELP